MNQLFKSLYDSVVINTNRPNLVAETKKAIKEATLELHNRGSFVADVREAILTSTNGGKVDFKFSIPKEKRVRKILNVSPVDNIGRCGIKLTRVGMFEQPKCGAWYSWANGVLKIHVPEYAPSFLLSFLSFPDLDEQTYESWIAEVYPHYITDLASFRVLNNMNMTQQAGIYKTLVGEARLPGTHIFNLLQDSEEVEDVHN